MQENLVQQRLSKLQALIDSGECAPYSGPLKVGVDLGTANIAIVVLDSENNPVTGITYPSTMVKDGVVVDYLNATRVVSHLKAQLESRLGQSLNCAATAIPPGISDGNTKVIVNVVESAGLDVSAVIDEPVAAASALGIADGGVVDVGGGTTGLSILKKGQVIFSADEPTGGTHMTLVLAGALNLSYDEAESMKKQPSEESKIFAYVRPVIEKMATLTARWLVQTPADKIYLVGGASSFSQCVDVFSKATGCEVIQAPYPLLVTPYGIAMHATPCAVKAEKLREDATI